MVTLPLSRRMPYGAKTQGEKHGSTPHRRMRPAFLRSLRGASRGGRRLNEYDETKGDTLKTAGITTAPRTHSPRLPTAPWFPDHGLLRSSRRIFPAAPGECPCFPTHGARLRAFFPLHGSKQKHKRPPVTPRFPAQETSSPRQACKLPYRPVSEDRCVQCARGMHVRRSLCISLPRAASKKGSPNKKT